MKSVAIIIPAFGQEKFVALAAWSAWKHTPNATIIVIDDGETVNGEFVGRGIDRFIFQQYKHNVKSCTRSWNAGLNIARQNGIEYAVPTNSDVMFTPNWFDPIPKAINELGYHFIGPRTNAPGHCKRQHEASIQQGEHESVYEEATKLNGFCMVGLTSDWWQYGKNPYEAFDPVNPMAGNEDQYMKTAVDHGAKLCISRRSKVVHFRGVSRGRVGAYDGARQPTADEWKLLDEREPFEYEPCMYLGNIIERKPGCTKCQVHGCKIYEKTVPNTLRHLGGCVGCPSYG